MQKHKVSLKHAQNKTAVSYYWDGRMCCLYARLDVHFEWSESLGVRVGTQVHVYLSYKHHKT